jgi:hypothetical protein
MGYPIVAGQDSLSNVGWIMEIYSPKLAKEFYHKSTMFAICNTDHEEEIKDHGQTVWIRRLPDIPIQDYVIGQKLNYTRLTPSKIGLLIDQGKYFAFPASLVEEAQSDIKTLTEKWAPHGAQALKKAIDTAVYAGIYNTADASNQGNTAGAISGAYVLGASGNGLQITKSTVVDYICQCSACLDEYDIPDDDGGRFVCLPAWACAMLKNSDFADASKTGDKVSPLRNGIIGMIDRCNIVQTNALKSVTDTTRHWYAPFGHKAAVTFASQIVKKEAFVNPDDFGNLFRMLNVYGFKTVSPRALGMGYIKKYGPGPWPAKAGPASPRFSSIPNHERNAIKRRNSKWPRLWICELVMAPGCRRSAAATWVWLTSNWTSRN